MIDEIPAVIHCAVCQQDRPAQPMQWFSCEVCGAPATDVVRGRELELVRAGAASDGDPARSSKCVNTCSRRTTCRRGRCAIVFARRASSS